MSERRVQMVMHSAIEAEPGGKGCVLHQVHNPSVAALFLHQVFPVDLQIKSQASHHDDPEDIGVFDHEQVLICPTGKMNVDAYISYLLGEGDSLPIRVGKETKALANQAVSRFEAARHAPAAAS